jgi:hypothetical protein
VSEPRSWDVASERGLIDLRRPFGAVQEEVLDLLGRLSRTQWSAPTVLPGWDVHSIALHLLGGDIGRLSAAWREPGSASEDTFPDLAAAIERSNEEWLSAARLIPPPLLVELLGLTAGRVSQLFEEVGLWAPGTPVTWTGSGPSPVWLDVAREYTERWVHQAQIREAVGGPPLDDRRWLWPVLDVFMLCLPRTLSAVEAPIGTTLALEVTGHAGGEWFVSRGPERWHLSGGRPPHPQARLWVSADAAWRWLAGLLPRGAVTATVHAEGDPALWRPALGAVAVMTTGP